MNSSRHGPAHAWIRSNILGRVSLVLVALAALAMFAAPGTASAKGSAGGSGGSFSRISTTFDVPSTELKAKFAATRTVVEAEITNCYQGMQNESAGIENPYASSDANAPMLTQTIDGNLQNPLQGIVGAANRFNESRHSFKKGQPRRKYGFLVSSLEFDVKSLYTPISDLGRVPNEIGSHLCTTAAAVEMRAGDAFTTAGYAITKSLTDVRIWAHKNGVN
jgi:hypothetical protein